MKDRNIVINYVIWLIIELAPAIIRNHEEYKKTNKIFRYILSEGFNFSFSSQNQYPC